MSPCRRNISFQSFFADAIFVPYWQIMSISTLGDRGFLADQGEQMRHLRRHSDNWAHVLLPMILFVCLTGGCENKLNKAQQLLEMGSYPEARKIAEEEVASSPDDLRAHLILGMAKISQGSANKDAVIYKEGIRELEIASKGEEESSFAFFLLGIAHLRNPEGANKPEATKALEKALAGEEPENRAVRYLVSLSPGTYKKHRKFVSPKKPNSKDGWSYLSTKKVSSFIVPTFQIKAVPTSKRYKSRSLYMLHVQEVESETDTHYQYKERIYRTRQGFVSSLASSRPSPIRISRMKIYPGRSLFGLRGRPASRRKIKKGSAVAVKPVALNAWLVNYEYLKATKVYSVLKNQVRPGVGALQVDNLRVKTASAHLAEWGMEQILELLSMGLTTGLTIDKVEVAVGPINCNTVALNEKTVKETCANNIITAEFQDGLLKTFKAVPESGFSLVAADKLPKLVIDKNLNTKYDKKCSDKERSFFSTFYTYMMADRLDLAAAHIQFKSDIKSKSKSSVQPAIENLATKEDFLKAVNVHTGLIPSKLRRSPDVPNVRCKKNQIAASIGSSRLSFHKTNEAYLLGPSTKILACGGDDIVDICQAYDYTTAGRIHGITSDGLNIAVSYSDPKEEHGNKDGLMVDESSIAVVEVPSLKVLQSFPSLCISSIPEGMHGGAYEGCQHNKMDAFDLISAKLSLLPLDKGNVDECKIEKNAKGLTISSKKLGVSGIKVPHSDLLVTGEPVECMNKLAWRASCLLNPSKKKLIVDIGLGSCEDEACKQVEAAGCTVKKPDGGMPLLGVFSM